MAQKKYCKNSSSNKQGFTLVELAIVLVVIGLLLGMAFKGKSLVDAARIKAEMNKIQKLSTAMNVYYAKYDTFPGKAAIGTAEANSGAAMYESLIREGLLTENDFRTSGDEIIFWNFMGCNQAIDMWATPNIKRGEEYEYMCIYPSDQHVKTRIYPPDPVDLNRAQISGKFICQMETLLDDKNLNNGDGRIVNGANPKVDTTNWDCTNSTANSVRGTPGVGQSGYIFRIF